MLQSCRSADYGENWGLGWKEILLFPPVLQTCLQREGTWKETEIKLVASLGSLVLSQELPVVLCGEDLVH